MKAIEKSEITRLFDLTSKKQMKKDAQRGVDFSMSMDAINSKPINFYNHGCPVEKWAIDPEKVLRDNFQVFSTGDPFSVISPTMEIRGANINIHVGVEHKKYSAEVLLQEAEQLCRTAREHGALSITIALPEQYHPELNDFNKLLLKEFKVSGANRVYYYDNNYTGKLDELGLDVRTPQLDTSKVQPHLLLCCSANKPLAEKIAISLKKRGEIVKLYHIEGEGTQAKISADINILGAVVTIVQSTRPSPDEFEKTVEYQKNGAASYFFEAKTIARQAYDRGAVKINLINPYQFNARSDKAEDNTKGKTGAYVQQNGRLLAASKINHVVTAECHDTHTLSGTYTGKKIRGSAVPAISIIAIKLANEWLASLQGQIRLVTPDAGAAKRTKELTDQLQAILKDKLCKTRVLGEKQRDSHKDDSALISSLNSGSEGIDPNDKYLITDDETATGTTLCQAVENLRNNGAKDIAVLVIHNNMPIDWLSRQLCLARFFYLGVNDLHFSDTQEMGSLATSYEDLVARYSQQATLSQDEVETRVFSWFKDNIVKHFSDKSEEFISAEFNRFKSKFKELESRVRVHSLADEFANKVTTKPYMTNPYAFEYMVEDYKRDYQAQTGQGAHLPALAAAGMDLGLELQVLGQQTPLSVQPKDMFDSLAVVKELYNKIKAEPKLHSQCVKLLGIGTEGQILAGQLAHLLNKNGCPTGIAVVENDNGLMTNYPVYTGKYQQETLSVDRNSLGMGDVCIAVGKEFTKESKEAIINLACNAKVYCYRFVAVSNDHCSVSMEDCEKTYPSGFYTTHSKQLLFSPKNQSQETVEQEKQCQL